MSIRLGVLSTARINQLVLPAARASENVEVVAIASRELPRAQQYAAEHEIERAYGSYAELLEDGELDAVYIPLPNSLHVEWSERALADGKHVLCEKPLARSRGEAERAFDTAELAGRILAEAFMYRHHPQTIQIKSLLEAGAIGPLRLIRAAQSFPTEDADDVRLFRELEGGALMDVGCYCVHFARFIAGEPERVYGEQRLNADGVDLLFSGTMRFAGDVLAQFDSGIDVPQRDFLELVGGDGTIEVHDPWMSGEGAEPAILIHRDGDTERVDTDGVDAYRLQLEDFAAAIRGERAPLLGREDAIAQAAAIEALYASADGGCSVEVVQPGRTDRETSHRSG
jgi:D-xylose 1-dehydrogenase (NADP+, D-xylono-1,5-lactone-forming)